MFRRFFVIMDIVIEFNDESSLITVTDELQFEEQVKQSLNLTSESIRFSKYLDYCSRYVKLPEVFLLKDRDVIRVDLIHVEDNSQPIFADPIRNNQPPEIELENDVIQENDRSAQRSENEIPEASENNSR